MLVQKVQFQEQTRLLCSFILLSMTKQYQYSTMSILHIYVYFVFLEDLFPLFSFSYLRGDVNLFWLNFSRRGPTSSWIGMGISLSGFQTFCIEDSHCDFKDEMPPNNSCRKYVLYEMQVLYIFTNFKHALNFNGEKNIKLIIFKLLILAS